MLRREPEKGPGKEITKAKPCNGKGLISPEKARPGWPKPSGTRNREGGRQEMRMEVGGQSRQSLTIWFGVWILFRDASGNCQKVLNRGN